MIWTMGCGAGLFTVDDIEHLPVVGTALREARRASLDLAPERLRHETIRRVINRLARDLIEESRQRLTVLAPGDADAIRGAAGPVIGFSPAMGDANQVIKQFLHARMYRHWRVNRMTAKARRVTEELFTLLHGDTSLLPDGWRSMAEVGGGPAPDARAAQVVGDYIAGMTDRFALEEHLRLTDPFRSG